jgi:hypothetical protein
MQLSGGTVQFVGASTSVVDVILNNSDVVTLRNVLVRLVRTPRTTKK